MNQYIKNLSRIEFVVTMACTRKCKHCSEGEHTNCAGHIEADAAVNAIREVCKNYNLRADVPRRIGGGIHFRISVGGIISH